ncbi:hypothetical protein Skr01_22980 [Sphaerisporangium krabiense]|uniref:Protein kinase domain-containing protein n=1 Tax=Sphaerisporangium krabiense TaxID=763782 RepID=A0A7W8Z6L7_9ACTN|nr:serine/threonine-protein kinase [Sphaerisporangium krabiense]MBB5628048.1 hypothetical protein [Sphaerisporangium krabiense]GII62213.1 hypothetical protein Skr01_22980 [Sphaerisporangium krabiense]
MSVPQPPGPGAAGQVGGYRLVRRLGGGGQGVVYLGRSPSGEDVAVKVLHAWMSDDADARRRFMREVDVARRVAPFCTAKVLDMGIEDDRPYIVSEYVPGTSLEELVRSAGPRTGGGLQRLAVATMSALAAIHRAGIVHRDFKPSNIILGPEGPVVIDFGISRALDATRLTGTGSVGTPPYMAPEQFTDEASAGQSADVFSWACTMVFAATGHRAFPGETVPAVVNAILHREPDLSGVPEGLAPVLAACLAKNPGERPGTAELLRVLTGEDLPPAPPGTARPVPTLPLGVPWPTAPGPARPGVPSGPAGPEVPTGPGPRIPTLPARPGVPTGPSPSEVPAATVEQVRRGVPRRALLAAGAGVAAIAAAAVTVPSLLRERDNGGQGGPGALSTVTPARSTPARSRAASPTPAASAPVRAFGTALYDPITDHGNDIRSIAVGLLRGAPVAVSGGDDQTVRVFDLTGGRQLGKPYTRHTGWVRAVAVTELDGAPVAVTGSDDDTVRVWDIATRQAVGSPFTGHTGDVKALAVGHLGGAPVVVSGGVDLSLRVWDPATGKEVRPAMRGHTGTIWSIAYGEVDGRPVVVTAGDDRTVRVWDLTKGVQLGGSLLGHKESVRAVAFGRLDGRPVAVSGGVDKTMRVWDVAAYRQVGDTISGHDGPVWAVAFDEVDDVPLAISGSDDSTVRVWDLRSGKPVGKAFTGHTDCVWAVTTGRVGGAPVVVSGSRDETVRVWSLAPPFPPSAS